MKAVLYAFETKMEPWVTEAREVYQKKINAFFPFEIESIKSPNIDREDADRKRKAESEKFLKLMKPGDLLVLFDEGGKAFKDSETFSIALGQLIERSPSRLVFLIGGAFGVDGNVRKVASATWSLSGLTMNHWIAQIASLEQIYRALTIRKNIPYHNR
jgi:23S rRNA (pseudouridine1915-N3)-methyltransferase